jgi:hypothetical protein
VVLGVRAFDHVVLEIGLETVLRAEDRGELAVGRRAEPINDMAEVVVDRGRIGEHADAQAVQALRREQSFRAKQHKILGRPTRGEGAVRRGGTVA